MTIDNKEETNNQENGQQVDKVPLEGCNMIECKAYLCSLIHQRVLHNNGLTDGR